MKEVKSEREPGSRRRHRDGDVAAAVVVKQERLSPKSAPAAHRRSDFSGCSPSPPAGEPGRPDHRSSRARGGSRSPAKKKNKSSGRRSKSPRSKRSRSPHHSTVKVRGTDRDRHQGHSRQRKSSGERPGSGPPQERERDSQNLQAQEEKREFYNARRREHRQKSEGSGSGSGAQELVRRPGGNNKDKEVPVKEKPSFELSGALLEDTNTFRDVIIKYSEPPEARIPKKRWRLYPFKNDEVLPVMYIHRRSAYLLGRHPRIADIPVDHPSCSKQHEVFQYAGLWNILMLLLLLAEG
ncbi:Smad nuclear-interacting protein 1 [Heterocephalus glaber]|uniref:Smad nuclear-interacting protein 1 n=1 Tax=Heterocephalus glaber TaxID=10181 RepID=G5B4G2_HETGA|nr:Smad nuclear-interacting protein 1 [Heterocephalus glaber]